jgi:hypothetical protein
MVSRLTGGVLAAASAAAVLSLRIVTGAASQPPAATVDVRAIGPRVGERVPDFTLPDQHGRQRTRASLMGPAGLMLVFFRSADW